VGTDIAELKAEVDAIRWYHAIDLGNGVRTPGLYDPADKVARYHIPADLSGRTVLDIGAWDGFFSFEAERRGAARVLATDSYAWSGTGWGSKRGFELARRVLESKVEDHDIDVMDLTPERIGTFDVVLFLGVLYHLRHPMLAIEKVASVCDHQLILETHVDCVAQRKPTVRLYNWMELDADTTNFCGPNPAAVALMLYAAGFTRVEIQPPASRLYNVPKWVATRLLKRGHRMVFHAFK
jgi:tRNA (mo5U34)-methyltransferase